MKLVGLVVGLLIAIGFGLPGAAAFGAGTGKIGADLPGASRLVAAHSQNNRATFGIEPSGPTKLDSRGYFDFGATAGGVIEDHVAVVNYSLKPLTLQLAASDALITTSGGFALQPPNHPSTQLGTWVHLPSADLSFTIPPRSFRIIPFTVHVPANASPGDHAGGILATLQSFVESKSGQKVKLLQSVGSRIFLRVSGPLYPGLTIRNLQVHHTSPVSPTERDRAVVTYTVANTGNVDLGGRQSVWVSGLFGTTKHAAKVPEVQLLLPGFSVRETAVITGILPELYETAHVSITPLVIPGSVQPKSGPFTDSQGFWAVPWVVIAVIVLVIALIVWLLRRRRRRQSRGRGEPVASPTPDAHATVPNGSGSLAPEPAVAPANASSAPAIPEEVRSES